jgi:hypothetical protein
MGRERGGSPIGRKRLVRLGAAAFACLRMLTLYGQEMGDERSVPMIGMPLRRIRNGGKRNERATLTGGRCATRLGMAIGRVRLPQRRRAGSFKSHSNTVSIQDSEPVPTLHVAKGVPPGR